MSLLLASLIFYASQTGVPIGVAVGLMLSESGGHLRAVSSTGDLGPWQLNPKYHQYFRETYNGNWQFDEFNAEASSRIALRYLADLHRRLGSWTRALEAYKCGAGRATDMVPMHIKVLCRRIAKEPRYD